MKVRLVNDVCLDENIFADKLRGAGGIGQNSAYAGRGKHHVHRLLGREKSFDFRGVHEVELVVRPSHKVRVSTRLQLAKHGRTHQSSVTSDKNLVCSIHSLPIRAICR